MKTFECACGARLFFDNVNCLSCNREVGWCPSCSSIAALEPLAEGGYRCLHESCGAALLKCSNYSDQAVCNRMVEIDTKGEAPSLCDCCEYNAMIPDLTIDGHRERWADLEAAKRRLFYCLDTIGLPHGGEAEGFVPALSFAFLTDALPDRGLWRDVAGQRKVYTGHANGRITINIKEADDLERERLRTDMNESHRTLLGHFRHEIGHYYWDLLIKDRDEAAFVAVFGDHNNPGYADALETYYAQGPAPDWAEHFISAYASMHPWEDFAECFAFYLTIESVLDTARHWRLLPDSILDHSLDARLAAFNAAGLAINEINRERGLLDLVPEVVTPAIHAKLEYIDGRVGIAVENGLSH